MDPKLQSYILYLLYNATLGSLSQYECGQENFVISYRVWYNPVFPKNTEADPVLLQDPPQISVEIEDARAAYICLAVYTISNSALGII